MDKKDKIEKKRTIGTHINLGNGRYKDNEVETLYNLATNHEKYNGMTKTVKRRFDGWSSDGKYTREEETIYAFKGSDKGVHIEEKYQYFDDDGQRGEHITIHDTGRDILNLFKRYFAV